MEQTHHKTDKGDFAISFVQSFSSADEFAKENVNILPNLSEKEAIAHLKEVYKKAVKSAKKEETKES